MSKSKDFSEKAIEILRATEDGNRLSPSHLKLVELAVTKSSVVA